MEIKTVVIFRFLLIFIFYYKIDSQQTEVSTENLNEVFKLINHDLGKLQPNPSGKAIFLVGLTGSGKSTFAKFITLDNRQLTSVEIPCNDENGCDEGFAEYYIKDVTEDKVGSDATISKTVFPEIFIDQYNSEALVDCPGFMDTRSEGHEIAIAIFMKRIFRWATKVKIIFVVNHGDVRTGASRNEFKTLLKFVTILLKDFDAFSASTGLVVTKVTNEFGKNGLVSDDQMIAQVARFLKKVSKELVGENPNDSMVKVLDSLLINDRQNKYPNIGIFRRPYMDGPLQNISAIQATKPKIRNMIYSQLVYANATNANIGFAISPAATLLLVKIYLQIKNNINSKFENLNYLLFENFRDKIIQYRNNGSLQLFVENNKMLFELSRLDHTTDFETQLNWFFGNISAIGIYNDLDLINFQKDIFDQTIFLKFCEDLYSDPAVKKDSRLLNIIPTIVQNLIKETGVHVKKFIGSLTKKICTEFLQYYKDYIKQTQNYEELKEFLQTDKNLLTILKVTTDFEAQVQYFSNTMFLNKVHIKSNVTTTPLINFIVDLNFLKDLSNDDNALEPNEEWLTELPNLVQDLSILMGTQIKNEIEDLMQMLKENLVQFYKNQFQLNKNYQDLKTFLTTDASLMKFLNETANFTIQLEYLSEIMTMNKFHRNTQPKKTLKNIIDHVADLNFLQNLSKSFLSQRFEKESLNPSKSWLTMFTNITHQLAIEMGFEVNECVVLQFQRFNFLFNKYYQDKIKSIRNYDELIDILEKDKNRLSQSSFTQDTNFKTQLEQFLTSIISENIHLDLSSTVKILIKHIEDLNLLHKKFTTDSIKFKVVSWSSEIPNLVKHLDSLIDWYKFMMAAFERLSQNDVQSKKESLNMLKYWSYFKQYISDDLGLSINSKIQEKDRLEEHEQKTMNDVLLAILGKTKGRSLMQCQSSCELMIEGYFVRMSDIKYLIKLCNDIPLKTIYIFAQYTVFFDDSLVKIGSELLLAVIAPKWEVIGQQTINLNGTPGPAPSTTINWHGQAGLPGGQAGTFFGIGYDFVNGGNLNVYTNGGVGGNGQNGKKGTDGHGDIDIEGVKDFFCKHDHLLNAQIRRHKYNTINYIATYDSKLLYPVHTNTDVTITVKIEEGPEATVGYDGGIPGLGGYNGISSEIKSLNKNKSSNVVLHNNRGAKGQPGKGGNGGRGEIINGNVIFKSHWIFFLPIFDCRFQQQVSGHPKPSPRSGFDGIQGTLIQPKHTVHATLPILTSYRKFLVDQTTDRNTVNAKSSYKLFLDMI